VFQFAELPRAVSEIAISGSPEAEAAARSAAELTESVCPLSEAFPKCTLVDACPSGSAFTHQECTTIKIGDDPEGPIRLVSFSSEATICRGVKSSLTLPLQVTYLSSAQGFVWNPEIFVPSYCDHDYVPLEQRRDPVHEIHLSDDDIKKIIPQ
jgi:hypothetical protein